MTAMLAKIPVGETFFSCVHLFPCRWPVLATDIPCKRNSYVSCFMYSHSNVRFTLFCLFLLQALGCCHYMLQNVVKTGI